MLTDFVLWYLLHTQKNSAVRQSLECTTNRMLFKIFGAMSKDFYRYIWECFSTDPVEPVNTKTSGQVQ